MESVDLGSLVPVKEPPAVVILNMLEVVESMKLEGLQQPKEPPVVGVLNVLEILESARVGDLMDVLERTATIESEVERLEKEFRNSGAEHECPIYERVIFDGKTCVPYYS